MHKKNITDKDICDIDRLPLLTYGNFSYCQVIFIKLTISKFGDINVCNSDIQWMYRKFSASKTPGYIGFMIDIANTRLERDFPRVTNNMLTLF